MIARRIRNALVPLAFGALAAAEASAQVPQVDWTLYSPTGDVAEIGVQGSTAWVAADGGVVRIDMTTIGAAEPDQKKFGVPEGLVDTDLTSLEFDAFGNVWVGTRTKGISVFDPTGRHLEDLSSFDTIRSDLVVDLRRFGNQVYVVSTDAYTPQGGFSGGGYVAVEVAQSGNGTTFTPTGLGVNVDLIRTLLPEGAVTWIGTSTRGLLMKDETQATEPVVVKDQSTGLLSNNVKQLVRAPNPDQGGASVLWVGTSGGIQTWDGAALFTVGFFANQNILDISVTGSTMLVLAETPSFSRDLYQLDLAAAPLTPARVPRAVSFPDTLYIPRHAAVDGSGRIVLGTQSFGFAVREGAIPFAWKTPPPLGPHFPTVSDLAVGADGKLYFGTDPSDVATGVGAGIYDGTDWSVIPFGVLVNRYIREVAVWPDTTVWFASAIDAFTGGLNHYFPSSGTATTYHDSVPFPANRIHGKNCRSLVLDRFQNLWVVVGQGQALGTGGGISVIEWPSLQVTNFPVNEYAPGFTSLLRDLALDSRDRLWITTFSSQSIVGQVYVVDPNGTFGVKSDDRYKIYNLANEIADIGVVENIEIDSQDQIWLAGEKGLVVGRILADAGGEPNVDWTLVTPGVDQTGGRNPLPYTAAQIDSDDSIWLGTDSSGLVNVSRDTKTWTWYDQEAGHPLPDPSIRSIFLEKSARRVWIGTATAGIARLDLRAVRASSGDRVDPQVFPNPWRPKADGPLSFRAIPTEEEVTLRIYTLAGELVYEGAGLRGTKTWGGTNLGDQLVEAGTYVVTATSTAGRVYEGKVAVLR